MKAMIKIFRKEKGRERYDEFSLEIQKGMTVMDCIREIKKHCDGSIAHRGGCRNGICGNCAMNVNGKPMLACKAQAVEAANDCGEIVIEPLSRMPVIKDLVVDMKGFLEEHKKVGPWVEEKDDVPDKENIMTKEQMKTIDKTSDCILCGACYAACLSLDTEKKFVGPSALVMAKRYLDDTRDDKHDSRLKMYNGTHFAWDCTHCMYCDEVCPVGIRPLSCIKDIRREIVLKDYGSKGVTHHKAFANSIEGSGILDESKYPIFAIGMNPLRLHEIIPVGMRMIKSGKMPDMMHKPAEKLAEIKKLFKEVKE